MKLDSSNSISVEKIRVLVVDHHAVVRQGLRIFIELQADMTVVGEGTNGVEAVKMAAQLTPDVILLDLIMPEMGGVEATEKILVQDPNARVLILTSFGEDDQVFPAIRAGAQVYLLKDIPLISWGFSLLLPAGRFLAWVRMLTNEGCSVALPKSG